MASFEDVVGAVGLGGDNFGTLAVADNCIVLVRYSHV
jgi:hypothetical protein